MTSDQIASNQAMPGQMTSDQVAALRETVVGRGYQAVLLIGDSEIMRTKLVKVPLVLAHVAVFVPSDEDKAWLEGICAGGVQPGDAGRLVELVAHAAEHGAQAVIAAHPALADLAGEAGLVLPLIDAKALR